MKRVAVLGGTGFVGSALISGLVRRGCLVRAFARSRPAESGGKIEWIQGARLGGSEARALIVGADTVFNCSGEIHDRSRMWDSNVGVVEVMMAEVCERRVHWVQLGSVGVYGARATGEMSENTPIAPSTIYERTKGLADEALARGSSRGLRVTILRPAAVYGMGMTSPWLRSLVVQLGGRRPFVIGRGKGVLALTHVANVVEALVRCGEVEPERLRIFNLAEHISVSGLAQIVAEILERPLRPIPVPAAVARAAATCLGWLPGFPLTRSRIHALTTVVTYPSEEVKRSLGYQDVVPLEAGLREVARAWLHKR